MTLNSTTELNPVSQSKRQLLGALCGSLLGGAWSVAAAQSANSTRTYSNQITATNDVWIDDILVDSGSVVVANQSVLQLDQIFLKRAITAAESKRILATIDRQRKISYANAPDLSKAIQQYGLKNLVPVSERSTLDAQLSLQLSKIARLEKDLKENLKLYSNGVISMESVSEIRIELTKARNEEMKIREARSLRDSQNAEEIKNVENVIKAIDSEIALAKSQLAATTLSSPLNGKIEFFVFPGMFIPKGQPLFSVL